MIAFNTLLKVIPMPSSLASLSYVRLLALSLLVAMGCGTPPKPPELDAFEKLSRDPAAEEARKRSPDLMKSAERHLSEAREQWQGNDLAEARNSSLLGQIQLKHALALVEQDRAKRRTNTADEDMRRAQEEYERAQKDLAAVNESVSLLKRLQDAAGEKQRLTAEDAKKDQVLAAERLKAAANEKISVAELAIKTADTVMAGTHAKGPYQAARDNIARAQTEISQGNFAAAQTSAEMAKIKAEEATAMAKPIWAKEAQATQLKTQAEDLVREATTIPGLSVRRDARGSLQRIVLPLQADRIFSRRDASVTPGKDAVLDPISTLIKKYAAFQVMLVGHTDNRGRKGELLALSQARAQSVYTGLVSRGVDAGHIIVSGLGDGEPTSDNRTTAGRAANSRVEIIFLYQ